MQKVVIIIFLCNLFAAGQSKCPDGWFEYNYEKCYKILENLVPKENAAAICNAYPNVDDTPKLLEIHSAGEQAFVSALIFEQSQIFDSVWLGIVRYNATNFHGSNGSPVYNNWLNDSPSDNVNNQCAQLSSGISREQETTEAGFWTDVPCSKRNLVVCQTSSIISLKELQDAFYQLQNVVYQMKNNPTVPIGFIYTEYPDQSSPQEIWPSLVWKNVTSKYAGHFFRAEGGDSGIFGVSQSDNAPRLITVDYIGSEDPSSYTKTITIPVGHYSPYIQTGWYTQGHEYFMECLRFENSAGEVRPINQAVRIWERVA